MMSPEVRTVVVTPLRIIRKWIALSGAFDVLVDDGERQKKFELNRSYYGLYIPAGLWRTMENFSTNSFALEFGSVKYSAEDYIRDYDEFLKLKKDGKI